MNAKGAAPGAVLTGAGDRDANGQVASTVSADRRDSFGKQESTVHTSVCTCETSCMTRHYLSLQGVANYLAELQGRPVSRNSVAKYNLPAPDVIVGEGLNAPRGWTKATIRTWHENRPGPGNWGTREVAGSKGNTE